MKIITLAFLLILGCGGGSSDGGNGSSSGIRQEGWTDFKVNAIKSACTESLFKRKGSDRITLEKAREFCSCAMDELTYKFPYSDFESFPEEAVKETRDSASPECAKKVELNWDNINGLSLFDNEENL